LEVERNVRTVWKHLSRGLVDKGSVDACWAARAFKVNNGLQN